YALGVAQLGGFTWFWGYDSFSANDPSLYRSDGTSLSIIGTQASPSPLVAAGNLLFYAASSSSGYQLFRATGTMGDLRLIDINPAGGSSPEELTPFGNGVLFSATVGVHGAEQWFIDGFDGGLVQLADLQVGAGGSDPHSFAVVGPRAFFAAQVGG